MKSTFSEHLLFLLSILSFSVVLVISCSSEEPLPTMEPPEKTAPYVETITAGFVGNGDVSIDPDGNLLVSEYGRFENSGGSGSKLTKVSSSGETLHVIENLSGPLGNEPGADDLVYVNNDNNLQRGNLLRINVQTDEREKIAEIPGWSSGMTTDAAGNIYVANFSAPTVHKITPSGELSVYATDNRLTGSTGLEFDSNGNLIICNLGTANIYSINPQGQVSLLANIPNIVIDNFGIGYITILDDVIYATGIAVNKVFKVTMDGEVSTLAGTGTYAQEDGTLLEASFRSPNGIASDNEKKILYISEYTGNGGLRKIQL